MSVTENRYQRGFLDSLGPSSWEGAAGGVLFTAPLREAWVGSSLFCFSASAAVQRQLCTYWQGDLRRVISRSSRPPCVTTSQQVVG